jgi:hypothetical protein
MKAKLLKKMIVDGKSLPAGSVLDVSGWRNAKSLESMRYIAFILEDEAPAVEKSKVAKAKEEPAVKEISLS